MEEGWKERMEGADTSSDTSQTLFEYLCARDIHSSS
jgi:hypothetical protein